MPILPPGPAMLMCSQREQRLKLLPRPLSALLHRRRNSEERNDSSCCLPFRSSLASTQSSQGSSLLRPDSKFHQGDPSIPDGIPLCELLYRDDLDASFIRRGDPFLPSLGVSLSTNISDPFQLEDTGIAERADCSSILRISDEETVTTLFSYLISCHARRVDELQEFMSQLSRLTNQLYSCISASRFVDYQDWVKEMSGCMPTELQSSRFWPILLRDLYKGAKHADNSFSKLLKKCFRSQRLGNSSDISTSPHQLHGVYTSVPKIRNRINSRSLAIRHSCLSHFFKEFILPIDTAFLHEVSELDSLINFISSYLLCIRSSEISNSVQAMTRWPP